MVNRSTVSVINLVTCVLLAACSQPQQLTSAPQTEAEAAERFIIKGSNQDTQAILSASQSYRILNAKHGLYEVTGLSYSEIKNIAPAVNATQNQYFASLIDSKKTSPYESFLADDEDGINDSTPVQQLPPALEGCDMEAEAKPEPVVDLLNPEIFKGSPTMQLGEAIRLSGASSTTVDENGSVEIRWDILTPNSSLLPADIIKKEVLELKPDALGFYQVFMVVKDEATSACNMTVARFLVTSNPEVEYAAENEPRPSVDLEAFSQLKKVEAFDAWEKATGKGVVIAVLDTGLHYNHKAIKFNLAVDHSEKNGELSVDEDSNSFDDDVLGWDFVNGDNRPFDDEGHGSHVSGLAASHIFGLAKDSRVLPVKVLNGAGGGDTGSVIAGIYYAVDKGARVINASLQRLQGQIPELTAAIEYAHSKNVVFISAAGNDSLDLSLPGNEIYPGEIDVPNVVNVAATGIGENLASYSNFGTLETDVAAPGGDQGEPLFSLAPLNPRDTPFIGSGGTSMASPIVAGIAALMIEANPELTTEQIRLILMTSGKDVNLLSNVVGSGKLLSASEAIDKALVLDIDSNFL